MRPLLFLIVLFFANNIFAQSDTLNKLYQKKIAGVKLSSAQHNFIAYSFSMPSSRPRTLFIKQALLFLREKQPDSLTQALNARYSENTDLPKVTRSSKALQQAIGISSKTALLLETKLKEQAHATDILSLYVAIIKQKIIEKKFDLVLPLLNIANDAAQLHPSLLLEIQNLKLKLFLAKYQRSNYLVSLDQIQTQANKNIHLSEQLLSSAFFLTDTLFFQQVLQCYEQAIEVYYIHYNRTKNIRYADKAFLLVDTYKEIQKKHFFYQKIKDSPSDSITVFFDDLLVYYSTQYLYKYIASTKDSLETIAPNRLAPPKYWLHKELPTDSLNLSTLQTILPKEEVIVSYLEGSDKVVYQFTLTSDTLLLKKIFWRGYRKKLNKYIAYLNNTSSTPADFLPFSYAIYHKLLHNKTIEAAKKLIILPDGLLTLIPFEAFVPALSLDSDTEITFKNTRYLIHAHNICYQLSVKDWLLQQKPARAVENSEIYGLHIDHDVDLDYDYRPTVLKAMRTAYQNTRYSTALLDSLENWFEGDYYDDSYNSEQHLKAYTPDYSVLYLSAPFVLYNNSPHLMLQEDGAEDEDNMLNFWELSQQNFDLELTCLPNTVLSNSTNKINSSYLALVSSLQWASSQAQLLPLWQTQDSIQHQILGSFFSKINTNFSKSTLLQQAKLSYIANSTAPLAHPYYWAGLTIWGNDQAIQIQANITRKWWFMLPIIALILLGQWALAPLRKRRKK